MMMMMVMPPLSCVRQAGTLHKDDTQAVWPFTMTLAKTWAVQHSNVELGFCLLLGVGRIGFVMGFKWLIRLESRWRLLWFL